MIKISRDESHILLLLRTLGKKMNLETNNNDKKETKKTQQNNDAKFDDIILQILITALVKFI